jgi:hypothetical protein
MQIASQFGSTEQKSSIKMIKTVIFVDTKDHMTNKGVNLYFYLTLYLSFLSFNIYFFIINHGICRCRNIRL